MSEFKLTKRMVFEAIRIVQAENGLEAAKQLAEWQPTLWNSRNGESSSEPYVDPDRFGANWSDDRPAYEVRSCRGHFHVTVCGEDLVGSYKTHEEAQAVADERNAAPAPSTVPVNEP